MSLKIDFYCDEKYYNTIPEPLESSRSFPKWFSDLPMPPKTKYKEGGNIFNLILNKDNTNIKKCVAITEFLKSGYLIPSWADFVFREQEDGSLYVNWVESYFDKTSYHCHDEQQYSTMPNKPIYGHFGKIFTPWKIKTSKGVSCLITHPVWHNNKLFTSSTVIFHTDVAPLNVPWFFEWNYKIQTKMGIDNMDMKNQVVPKGEPIILIIPFYRKKYSHTINYVSAEEIQKIENIHLNLTMDSYGECPYTKFRKKLGKLF